jgi:hypothetical protein
MQLKDMALSSEEKKDFSTPSNKAPEYPYGLCLRLGPEEFKKLGIPVPKVEDKVLIYAEGFVKEVEVSGEEGMEGKNYNVSLQVTSLEVKPKSKDESPSDKFYGY